METIGYFDTYNYEKYYIENFGRKEERLLTTEELHDLYFLCDVAHENNLEFILGFAPSSCYISIHKTPENKWIVSDSDERRGGYIKGIFDNIYDACISLINECAYNKEKGSIINEFNNKLKNELSNEELESFMNKKGYYDTLFYHDFEQYIKRMSGIEIENEEEMDNRINFRKKIEYPGSSSFGALVYYFIKNIEELLNIDTCDLYEELLTGKIDYKKYEKLRMERINLNAHQDLVLEELKKYNHEKGFSLKLNHNN